MLVKVRVRADLPDVADEFCRLVDRSKNGVQDVHLVSSGSLSKKLWTSRVSSEVNKEVKEDLCAASRLRV